MSAELGEVEETVIINMRAIEVLFAVMTHLGDFAILRNIVFAVFVNIQSGKARLDAFAENGGPGLFVEHANEFSGVDEAIAILVTCFEMLIAVMLHLHIQWFVFFEAELAVAAFVGGLQDALHEPGAGFGVRQLREKQRGHDCESVLHGQFSFCAVGVIFAAHLMAWRMCWRTNGVLSERRSWPNSV